MLLYHEDFWMIKACIVLCVKPHDFILNNTLDLSVGPLVGVNALMSFKLCNQLHVVQRNSNAET